MIQVDSYRDLPKRTASKPACTLCARRKVKCDRDEPACSNCIKHKADCRYEDATPPQRHTKRRADAELRQRIRHLERLLEQQGVDLNTEDSTTTSLPKSEEQSFADKWIGSIASQRSARPDHVAHHSLLPLHGPSCLKFIRKRYRSPAESSISASISLSPNTSLHGMYPEPRHIFRLWQLFAERTNPMTKIVHAPSVQQRILDMGWDTKNCSKSFNALLFSIFLIAVVSLSADECLQHFGEDRNTLMARYANGTWRSLMDAGLFETRDLEVLQALVLLILSDPASEMATTLSGLAVRIGLKMGLDEDGDTNGVSFFNQEIRVRLWWQICTQDILARHLFSSKDSKGTTQMAPDIRLPLNVNDAELHPDMVKPPVEYPRASEMVYVLLKYEGAAWGHRKRTQLPPKQEPTDFNFDELRNILENKYLRYCDPQIPIHAAAISMARSSHHVIQYMKLRIKNGNAMPTDELFEQALEVLELDQTSRTLPFAAQLVWSGWPIHIDAIIHVLTKLRQLSNGDRVAKAWDYVVNFWNEHIDADWEGDESFFKSLLDLTLEAWQERRKQMTQIYGSAAIDSLTPSCIKRLLEIHRMRGGEQHNESNVVPGEPLFDQTTDFSLLSQPEFDFNAMNIPQDWFGFNNNYLYNFGFWTDVSLL